MDDNNVTVTTSFIEEGENGAGGWNAAQIAILGFEWPPPSGWKRRAVGKVISRADAERFVSLRGAKKRDRCSQQPTLF